MGNKRVTKKTVYREDTAHETFNDKFKELARKEQDLTKEIVSKDTEIKRLYTKIKDHSDLNAEIIDLKNQVKILKQELKKREDDTMSSSTRPNNELSGVVDEPIIPNSQVKEPIVKNKNKSSKMIKILGLGHPRTGTGFTSKTLETFGLSVGHEKLERDGIVAWQLVSKKGPWPWMIDFNKLMNVRPDFEYLIYNTRNPKNSIPSIILTDDFKKSEGVTSLDYRRKAMNIPYSSNRVEQAILSIITFDNHILSMKPDLVYRIEDEYKKIFDFADSISPSMVEYVEPEKNVNSRPHSGWEELENELNEVRPIYRVLINNYCDRHGYDKMFDEANDTTAIQDSLKESKELKVSAVMMSYLGDYPNARTNPIPKFHRAIKSFLNQSYKNTELIIVSDGCEITNDEYNKHWINHDKVHLLTTSKTPYPWPGEKRQMGINKSTGDWIVYLDTDDVLHTDHISKIVSQIEDEIPVILNRGYALGKNFIKLNTIYSKDGKQMVLDHKKTPVQLVDVIKRLETQPYFILENNIVFYEEFSRKFDVHGTSRIFHKRDIPIKWENLDRRGEDKIFSNKLMALLPYKKIDHMTYVVCHVPNGKWKTDI